MTTLRLWSCFLPLILGLGLGPSDPVMVVQGTDPAQFELLGLTPDSIAIVGGEVRLTGKPLGYFATRQEYKDYVLSFEYRFDRPESLKSDADFRGNSGVLVHVSGPAKVWPDCVQVQLAQNDPGAIFAMGDSQAEASSDPKVQKSAIKPVGEWNKVELTSQAGRLVCRLNGKEVARGEKLEPKEGPIGWQSEGKPVRFREIRIQVLP